MITWAKLAAGLVSLFNAILAAVQRAQDRQAGRIEQHAADLKKSQEAEHGRRQTDIDIAAADPAERERLRRKWTAGAGR